MNGVIEICGLAGLSARQVDRCRDEPASTLLMDLVCVIYSWASNPNGQTDESTTYDIKVKSSQAYFRLKTKTIILILLVLSSVCLWILTAVYWGGVMTSQ